MEFSPISEYIENLPNICGSEGQVEEAMRQKGPYYLPNCKIDFEKLKSGFANALHMHQPLIPAGGNDLSTAAVISNLKYMMDNQHIHGNHDAPVFLWCYKRMGELITQLVSEGKNPRIMLDYSGCLLYGLLDMGAHDVIDSLKNITCNPEYNHTVEWLGTGWGHPVAPSSPVQDFRLHVQAWQHHFAAIFGFEALSRVRGFSPPEMALPNHPDVCYEFVKTLKECGYKWVMVQEHSVEEAKTGKGISKPHIPHRLVAKNSKGEQVEIIAMIKTQGSDTKIVAHMQPYHEAHGLGRTKLGKKIIPQLVSQIADGENGGVMMNEFPDHFMSGMRDASWSETAPVNVTEYLEYLEASGVKESQFPEIQPVMQQKIWDEFKEGAGEKALEKLIKKLEKQDDRFHMEGGSWTNNLSWVKGYDHVLGPMEEVSAKFAETVLNKVPSSEHRYRNALFYLLTSQTSCYRYWGEGRWTDYGRELCRRAGDILKYDF
ncbi:glycosyl hydrolase family 57 [Rapidithrix thailandica]|uniref:Glycosyl hydrolase family 57 n=1 Tax=Rapidithrix thailandica TaxID=413964 RepID=A0AAW9S543_9BACT